MRYLTFGRGNGLRVSEYALGTATFDTQWCAGSKRSETARMLDRFADAGGTFLDTAESYQAGESEEILGELLTTRRDQFTVATKFAVGINPTSGVQGTGDSRRNMIRAVEGSPARLRTDRSDLLWVHFPDPVTPTTEIVRALDDLVRSGKILYAGLSNFRPGAPRGPSPSPRCAAGPRSWACRSSTASSNAPPTGKSCRRPKRSAWARRSGHRWAAGC